MVPEKIAQMLTALKTPDFFIRDNRTATESIHDILRDYLARATDTMTVAGRCRTAYGENV